MNCTGDGPAAPGPGGEAESVIQATQRTVSGPCAQLNGSNGHVDRGTADVVRIGTELDVCDDAIDAVIRCYFLPMPKHVSIRDQAGLDWIRVRMTSPSRVVDLVEHHLRGRPLDRSLFFCDYHGVIDWPVTLGITASHDRILPMPTRADLERRGMLEDGWLPPDRVGRLQVNTVLGVDVSQPTYAEQAVLAQMQPRSGCQISITPINMGREFRVEANFQGRDDTHLALLRAGMSEQSVRLFGKHARMGTMLFDEFVFTDCLSVSIDGVDVRDCIIESETRIEECQEQQRALEPEQQRAHRRQLESQPETAIKDEADDLLSHVVLHDDEDNWDDDEDDWDDNGDQGPDPRSNGNPKAKPEKRARGQCGKREFLLAGHLPGWRPRETLVFAALAFRNGLSPKTGEPNQQQDVWEVPNTPGNVRMLAKTAGIANCRSVRESLETLLKNGPVENRDNKWIASAEVLRQMWQEGQRILLPAELLDGPATIPYEHKKADGSLVKKTMRRSPTALLVLGWMVYNRTYLERRPVNGTLLASILHLPAKTVRRLMTRLSNVGLLQTRGWRWAGKQYVLWRKSTLSTRERNGPHGDKRSGSHRA